MTLACWFADFWSSAKSFEDFAVRRIHKQNVRLGQEHVLVRLVRTLQFRQDRVAELSDAGICLRFVTVDKHHTQRLAGVKNTVVRREAVSCPANFERVDKLQRSFELEDYFWLR